MMRRVAVLGSTGSIGTTALKVLARHRDRFAVSALTAHGNTNLLAAQAAEWRPAFTGLVAPNGSRPPADWATGPGALVNAAIRAAIALALHGDHRRLRRRVGRHPAAAAVARSASALSRAGT